MIWDIGKYRLRARAGWYSVLIGESNIAIVPVMGGYGVDDICLGEFSPRGTRYGASRVGWLNLILLKAIERWGRGGDPET